MQTEEGVWVVVEVADNGSGMSEASRARVFEPFFTTKTAERGTGIGLSISETIAQNHGGRLFCESQEGEGTVFRMFLPVTEEI